MYLLLYDYFCDDKTCYFFIFLVSKQDNCSTCIASSQHFLLSHSRTNTRKFCPTFIGKYYWKVHPLAIRTWSTKILFKKGISKDYFVRHWFPCFLLLYILRLYLCVFSACCIFMCSVIVTFLFCSLPSLRCKLLCWPSEWVSVTRKSEPKTSSTDFNPIIYSPILETSPETKVFFRLFDRNVA